MIFGYLNGNIFYKFGCFFVKWDDNAPVLKINRKRRGHTYCMWNKCWDCTFSTDGKM